MKLISVFILLIYWSLVILAPVVAKNIDRTNYNITILPKEKPTNH